MRFLLLLLFSTALGAQPSGLDLFLLIGQSNMAGRGAVEEQDRQPVPGVFMLTKAMEWAPAVDPMHFDKPAIIGTGLGRSFARELLRHRPGAKIGLIPAAYGGSSLDEWTPEGQHYTDALRRAKKAIESGQLRGILWHQGEADAGKPELASTYRERFTRFLTALRRDLGPLPVVVGQLGRFYKAPHAALVNEQLALLPLSLDSVAFVSSAGLDHKGDVVHFDAPGLREFGRRYALAYLSLDPSWAQR